MNSQPVRLRTRSAAEIRASGSFAEAQAAGRYQGYTYSYPHKTSYGWFDAPLSLAELWSEQDLSNTFLYGHIPFCEMRCGFCNLFTTTNPTADAETLFVEAFERQARIVRSLLGPSLRITTGAIGGGTPTLLSAAHLYRVFAVNLSIAPTWASELPTPALEKLGLWATWHPIESSLRSFITRVQRALDLGVGLSIGVVATREHLGHVDDLANALLEIGTSLQWINAYKRGYRTPKDYYSPAELARLTELDPWFPNDLLGEKSAGRPCDTGTSTISVDGDGEVTRCHFTKRRLGNLYVDGLSEILAPEGTNNPCPRLECNCFQGYVHVTDTSLHDTFRSTAALSRRPSR